MKNTENKMNDTNMENEDQIFFDLNKNIVNAVNPEKEVLARILDKIDLKSVTNNKLARNTSLKMEDGRKPTISKFTNLINIMNNYIKILSGGAIVSALIITMIFINKSNDKVLPVVVNDLTDTRINNTTQTKVDVAGEVVDVDSLLVDLNNIDSTYSEPIFDNSDLTAVLINTNDYEI